MLESDVARCPGRAASGNITMKLLRPCLAAVLAVACVPALAQHMSGNNMPGHDMSSHAGHHASPVKAANGPAPEGVSVKDCWIRALPGSLPSAAYFQVVNDSDRQVTLVGLQSPAHARTMLHASSMQDGMSRMEHVASVPVPAHEALEFRPGGYHGMLEQASRTLEPGSRLPLILVFDGNRTLATDCEVRGPDGAPRH